MKTGVQTVYTASLSKRDKIKINTALKTTSVAETNYLSEFLEVTLDNANFPSKPHLLISGGFVSDNIPLSEYLDYGLSKDEVIWAMAWLVQNTPVRSLQRIPKHFTSGYARKIQIAITHNDLDLLKLILKIAKSNIEQRIASTFFDDNTLYIKGSEVVIGKQSGTKECWLLDTLFKEEGRKWHTDELVEASGYTGDDHNEYKTKKYYQLANRINKKIELKTGVRDFLRVTTKYIQIKTEYLN